MSKKDNRDNNDQAGKRVHGKSVPIKKSVLDKPNAKTSEILERVNKGKSIPDRLLSNKDVLEEIKRILYERGLSLEYIVDKYKELLGSEYDKPKARDILTVLERLEKLHGLDHKRVDAGNVPDHIKNKLESGEIDTYIIAITNKTQGYIERLERAKRGERESVEDGEVIPSDD